MMHPGALNLYPLANSYTGKAIINKTAASSYKRNAAALIAFFSIAGSARSNCMAL